jgi:hypothetical protein
VVNVYDANEITSSVNTSIDASEGLFAGASPRPIRELMNLTTEITNIAFNHDAQMMAISSSKKKDAFRMVSTERRRNTNGEFTLTIDLRLGSVVPLAFRFSVYELADIIHPTWGCHMFRLFGGERVRGDGEYSREDSLVQRRALQAARRIGRDLYVDRIRLIDLLLSVTVRPVIVTFNMTRAVFPEGTSKHLAEIREIHLS